MQKSYLPEGYNYVMPYLIVKNASGFTDYMKEVFGAEEKFRQMRDSTNIMHAELLIGDSVIMYADANADFPPAGACMFICVPDADAAYHKAIAAGSVSVKELCDEPYGRAAGVKDPYGNTWWITSQTDS